MKRPCRIEHCNSRAQKDGLCHKHYNQLVGGRTAQRGPCHLYVLRSCQHIKIGISKDPAARIASINKHSPRPVETVALIEFPGRIEAAIAEAFLHRTAAEHHTQFEWYTEDALPTIQEHIERGFDNIEDFV